MGGRGGRGFIPSQLWNQVLDPHNIFGDPPAEPNVLVPAMIIVTGTSINLVRAVLKANYYYF